MHNTAKDFGFNGDSFDKWLYTSNKIKLLVELLSNLYSNKHRVLVFTKSTKMLDLLQYMVTSDIS